MRPENSRKVQDLGQLADIVGELCDSAAIELLDLQRFYMLARLSVEHFDPAVRDITIPWELSDMKGGLTIHLSDEEDLVNNFLSRLLPQYSLVLMVSIMDSLFDNLRRKAGWGRRQKKKGFGLPVPPGFSQSDLDNALCPLVARYIEVKAARNIIVHNRGVADENYIRQAGTLARAQLGEVYPLSHDYFWEAFVCCRNLITTIELLWRGQCVVPPPPSHNFTATTRD